MKEEDLKILLSYIILKIFNLPLFTKYVSDTAYLKVKFYYMLHRKLDFNNVNTLNEKIQWLKLNARNPLFTQLVDKYEVRQHIAKTIGEEYLVPLLGVWNNFKDIDFNGLPNRFVLKTTHDSGGVVICKNKKDFKYDIAKAKLNTRLKCNWYNHTREWPYKDVKPRIIGEQFIGSDNGDVPDDYKLHCFNGKVDNIMVCTERESGNPQYYFFDRNWNLLRYCKKDSNLSDNFTLPKPLKLDEMIEIAEKLSHNLIFCRIDLYFVQNVVLFGEITFYPDSGFDDDITVETDYLFGSKISLN